MTNNRKAKDSISDQMNPYFRVQLNPNWKALIEAIGESDQEIADLVQEVRKQFFVSTSTRPYIDKLASNVKISRPKVVGMDDQTMRKYIPILAYQPKQVKLVLDQLLDIFFFKESTTAFAESSVSEPFLLKNGWDLTYLVDNSILEEIYFKSEDFADISNATVDEVVACINRQAKKSFAVAFDNRIQKKKFIRIFTNTIGSKGSVEVTGGRANISINFPGFIENAGSGSSTKWQFSKIGDTIKMQHVQGSSPSLEFVQAGDVAILDFPNNFKNSGSFIIKEVNLSDNYIKFTNLFSTEGIFDHSLVPGYFVRFISPRKSVVYTRDNRSVVWEAAPGEIVIEMPSTPPVVRRKLKGSAHINGLVAPMINRISDTSLELDDASDWPNSGKIVIEPTQEIKTHILTSIEDDIISKKIEGRYDCTELIFNYTNKNGNVLSGISPNLPFSADIFELDISSLQRDSNNIVTVTTTTNHNLSAGTAIRIYSVTETTNANNFNGTWLVDSVVNSNSFKYKSLGSPSVLNDGKVRIEKIGLSNNGSRIYLNSAIINTKIIGPMLWDTGAPFVLSSYTGKTITDIKSGNIVLNLSIDPSNNIPQDQGFLIFDYGLKTQEGPVRYLYKASNSTIVMDPAYVFQYNHLPGSEIVAIRRKGAHVLDGLGKEYGFYVSDPSAAREVLKSLISSVKSVGVYLRYIIKYPNVVYSEYDLYGETSNLLD